MTAVFVESEYEIELASTQGPAGPGLSAIANNTLLGNTSGGSATPVANALKTYIGQKSVFANDAVLAENKTTTNVWCYAGASADLNVNGSTCLFGGQLSGSVADTVTDTTSWGIWALRNLVTGNGNTAVGVYAFRDAVTMSSGTAVGDSALMKCLVGSCTAVGYGSGSRTQNGVGSNFYGAYAGWRGDKGDYNYIEGFYANSYTTGTDEEGVTLGDGNWISGYYAGYRYTGNYSRIRGYEAALNWVTGDNNFVDGYQAGTGVTSGSHNVFIGWLSGAGELQAGTVNNSIGIGKQAFTTQSNQVVLGNNEITDTILRGSITGPGGLQLSGLDARKSGPSIHRIVDYLELAAGTAGFQVIDSTVTTPWINSTNGVINFPIGISLGAGAHVLCSASTTSKPALRIPHGTAPASPVDGDVWTTTAGLFVRINGSTIGPLS